MAKVNQPNPVRTQLESMRSFVVANLNACCQEAIEWQDTGTLKTNSKLKEAASRLTDETFAHHKMTHVENFVKTAAMEFIVKGSVSTS
jgi:hypothetical protein